MNSVKLQIPNPTFSTLKEEAERQGVSIEVLCLSLITEKFSLVDPALYISLPAKELRAEVRRVLDSGLPEMEKKRRVRLIETTITRFIR